MKRKTLAMLLTVIMVLGLAGCIGKTASSSESDSVSEHSVTTEETEKETAVVTEQSETDSMESIGEEAGTSAADEALPEVQLPLAAEEVTFSYWVPMPPADSKGVRPDEVSFNAYMLEQTNISFDFVGPAANAAGENFSIMVASGDYPDFIEKFGNYFTAGYESAIEQEIIMDVSELIDEYMPHYAAAMYATEGRVLAVSTDSGAIPGFASFYLDPADDDKINTGYGAVIRMDWLEALNMDLPTTYDAYYDVLTAFKENYDATMWLPNIGVATNNAFISGYNIAGFSSGSTVPFYVENDEVKYGPMETGFYEYISMMAKWYAEGLIYQDFPSGTDVMNCDSNLYAGGTVGLFFCSNRAYNSLLTSYPDLNLGAAINPVQNEGDAIHIGTANSANTVAVVMSSQCAEPELAAKLVDWMFTDEASFHARYGFEGEAYTYNAAGEPEFTDLVYHDAEGKEAVEALAALSINYFVWHSDPAIELELQGQAVQTMYEIWGQQDGNDWNYPPSATMTDDEATTFSQAYSDIETYVHEQTLRWICGETELTEDAFSEYQEKIEAMNIRTCIETKQAAYDRYTQRSI